MVLNRGDSTFFSASTILVCVSWHSNSQLLVIKTSVSRNLTTKLFNFVNMVIGVKLLYVNRSAIYRSL